MNDRNVRAASLMGLLEPALPDPPTGKPIGTFTRGHWEVQTYERAVLWRCLCGRSEPLLLLPKDATKVRLPLDGLHCCEVCRAELESARTKYQRLRAWINQHRACLKEESCLEFPDVYDQEQPPNQDKYSRTRRFVFEQFWKKTVPSGHYVRLKCSNANCINPYHLCLTRSPATKLTPEATRLVQVLVQRGVSTATIQALLREQLSIELSMRSIQRTKKELAVSKSCVS